MQSKAQQESLDFLNIGQDKKILEQLEPGGIIYPFDLKHLESILFSWKVIKYTGSNHLLPRIFTLTNKNIYNVEPVEGQNTVVGFFQSLVGKTRIKRKISLSQVGSVTVSKVNNDFIIHVPSQYDQRYSAETYRERILLILCDMYIKNNFKKLIFHFVGDLDLVQYTTTTYDLKKGVRRTLPQVAEQMDMEEVKAATALNKHRSTTVFQRNKQIKEVGIEDFNLIKVLGRGAFGKVMLCEKKNTNEIYAIKSLKKEDIIARDHQEYLKTERKILEQINHPFLVSLEYAFQTEDSIYFVMKFMKGGELFTHLQRINRFNENMALFYGSQVLLALEYLHKLNIIYRDLKPENILMDESGYVALTDYGLAKFLQKGEQAQSIVGTPEYLAPEVITQTGHAFSADWWCLGILIYEMVCGRTPFFSENRNTMFKNICDNQVTWPNNVQVTQDCKNLITSVRILTQNQYQKLLKKKPMERLGTKGDAEDIKKHPWFKQMNFKDLLEKKIKAPFIPEVKDDQDLQNFNPAIVQQAVDEDEQQQVNTEALKKFDQEFYGLTYVANKLP